MSRLDTLAREYDPPSKEQLQALKERERRARRVEQQEETRRQAAEWAKGLLGRVIFPGRWDVQDTAGLKVQAVFEGRLVLLYEWSRRYASGHGYVRAVSGKGSDGQWRRVDYPQDLAKLMREWEEA